MSAKGKLNGVDMATATSAASASQWLASPSIEKWLTRLNNTIGDASRKLFQSQLVLRAASEREIRAQLPDLCTLASSICGQAATSKQRTVIRAALSDPQAQWLSRGAVQSGASGFFCHLLLRGTAQHENSDDAAQLVIQLLLEPVLKSCIERNMDCGGDGASHRACDWRFEKPKYYAMACASLWETLLPFLARAARQHPTQFSDALNKYLHGKRRIGPLVNCRFAQVAGFWRLLELLSEKSHGHPAIVELQPKILSFAVQWSLLPPEQEQEQVQEIASRAEQKDSHVDMEARFYDLLMDKFFQEMHDFLFKCAHATSITCRGLLRFLQHTAFPADASSSTLQSPRLAAFTASACLLVKGLAHDVGDVVTTAQLDQHNMLWYVGIVSHADSIQVDVVLSVLDKLFTIYDEHKDNVDRRRDVLLWIIYIIVCRQRSLVVTTTQKEEDPSSSASLLLNLQERLCAVEMDDLQLMPLHWMEILWKTCFAMEDEEILAFVEEARAFRLAVVDDSSDRSPVAWEVLLQRVPFRHFEQYPAVMAILGSSYVETLQLVYPTPMQRHETVIENVLLQNAYAKRRRLRPRDVVVLSEEHEESRQNALLLPEVMERICSFVSAKRLCRLSLVCEAFATTAKSERVWQPLYNKLVLPLHVKCHHGTSYSHDWRLMCQAKYVAIRKLRNRQREANRKAGRQSDGVAVCWQQDDAAQELRLSMSTLSSIQLCQECGCNQLFSSNDAAKSHRVLHQKYRCPEPECRASLTSAVALKQHTKAAHVSKKASEPIQEREPSKPVFVCTVDGCSRSYKSTKWLETHVKREHHEQDLG